MVNGDGGDERVKRVEKGRFGMMNDDGGDKRGKGENERLPLVW